MAKKKIVKEQEVELTEDSTAAASLRPKGGTASTGEEENSVEPSRFEMISRIMGALSHVDKDTLKYFNGMMATHTAEHLGKGVGENSAHNKDTLKMHGSDAVGGSSPRGAPSKFGQASPGDSGTEDGITSRSPSKFGDPNPREDIRREVGNMFNEEEGLSEEFKEKAAVIFEAALEARVAIERTKLEDAYETALTEELENISEELENKVAVYIEYVAEEWMKENEVAIESALRSEITTEFMTKLRDLFKECNVNIPEDQIDVVDTLASKNEELESRLAEAVQEIATLRKVKEQVDRDGIVAEATKGLTLVDSEKLKTLAEGLDSDDAEDFARKVKILRENIKPAKKSTVETLLEEVDENNKSLLEDNDKTKTGDPRMQRYLQAIDGTTIRTGE